MKKLLIPKYVKILLMSIGERERERERERKALSDPASEALIIQRGKLLRPTLG